MTDHLLDAALEYAARGWPVFPLEGKEPITSSGVKDATTDERQIREWWRDHPRANIGLACGEASAVVVDDDGPKAKEAIAEYARVHGIETAESDLSTSRTKTAKGEHLYFSWSDGCEKLKNWTKPIPDTDIRTTGGYVVAPPSIHPDTGEPYTWIVSPDNLRPFPSWLIDLLLEAKVAKKATDRAALEAIPAAANKQKVARMKADEGHPYGKAALEREIATLRATSEGERNNTLNTAALKLFSLVKGGALGRGEVERELTRVARSLGLKDPEISKTLESAWTGATAREIPDDGPKATTSATGGREKSGETEDDGIKSISEEELNGLNLATRPKLYNRLEPDNFISEYLEFGAATCDAYQEYHFSGALTLLSAAVGRKLVIKLKQGPIYPNIWSFNLGPSTISRKSTAIAKMEDMLKVVCPDIAIPKSFSPEALIEFLSECPVAYLVKDEVGQLLASMRKQYMEDVRDFFSEIYDNRDFRRKLRTGKRKDKTDFKITDPYIVQSYATTNTLFREYTTPLDLTSGWLLRFLYFAPNYKKPSMAFEVETGTEAELYGRSLGRFSGLYRLFSQIEETEIEIEPEAMKFYQEWQLSTENALMEENDEGSLAMWGRLQVYALKLAVLFTVGKKGYQVGDKISLAYMTEAVRQVDEYFLPVGRSVAEEVGRAEQTNLQNKIIGTLERHGGKMKRPALLKSLHVRLKDISEALDALTESEEIEIRKEVKEGRKTAIWYLLVNNPNHRNNRNNPNNRNNRLDSTFEPGIDGNIAINAIIGTNAMIAKKGEEMAGDSDPEDRQTVAENLEEAARREAAYLEKFKTPEPKAKGRRLERLNPVLSSKPRLGGLTHSTGKAGEYSPISLNLYGKCTHKCVYCYNSAKPYPERIGKSSLPAIERDIRTLEAAGVSGPVHLCFIGDPYDLGRGEDDVRAVLELFHKSKVNFQILTKGGTKAVKDFDLYRPGDRFGVTLTFIDHEKSKTWEPGAALPDDRLEALKEAHKRGIETWASLEPVIDPAETLELIRRSAEYVDIFAVGRWNHDKRADSTNWRKFAADVVELLDSLGCDYYIKDDLKRYLPSERSETKKVVERSPPKNDPSEEEVKPSLTLAGFKELFQRRGLEEVTAPIYAKDQGIPDTAAKTQLDRAVKAYGLTKRRVGLDDYYRLPEEVVG